MKKRTLMIALVWVMVSVILLFPARLQLEDGGSIQYRALIYRITKVHALIPEEEAMQNGKVKPYNDGIIVEIFGVKVFEHVE